MEAIRILMNEHRQIERVLDSLSALANQVRRGGTPEPRGDVHDFAEIIRDFADRRHHGKEEEILFRAMVDAGFPQEGGPVAVMLDEHEQGRAYVRILDELAATSAPWTGGDRNRLAGAAESYVALLRAHIQKEDEILYPMAEAHLPPQVQDRVSEGATAFEREERESGRDERHRSLIEGLTARYPGDPIL
jgi:hemerythrin-like domain-containing protein